MDRNKPARITVLVDPASKKEFEETCKQAGQTPSEILRALIDGFVASEDRHPLPAPTRPRAKKRTPSGGGH